MQLDPLSRYFVKYDVTLRTYHKWGAPLALVAPGKELDVLNVLEQLHAKRRDYMEIKAGDILRLTDIKSLPKKNAIVLLFRRRDANASTQRYEHETTGKVRRAERAKDEHPAMSAHLVVSTASQPGNKYRAVLEEVPGIGRSYVRALLAAAVATHKYDALDSKKAKVETHTIVGFDGLPSQTLGQAVSKGRIDYVEMTRPAKTDGLDTDGLVSRPEKLRFGLPKSETKSYLARLLHLETWANNNGWKDIRVQVRSPDDRTKVVRVDREEEAAEVLFVEADQVSFTEPLAECADAIDDRIVAAALKLLAK